MLKTNYNNDMGLDFQFLNLSVHQNIQLASLDANQVKNSIIQ